MKISVTAAKGQLTDLVRRAEAGEEVIFTRHGHEAVRLTPVRPAVNAQSRRALLEQIRASAARKITAGPDAACSQDFLAVTVAEALIVASRRNVGEEMTRLVEGLGFEVIDLNEKSARSVAEAYEKWGKGAHPAALNFGDCFSYVVAKVNSCRLLYTGEDFSLTDLESALPPPAPKK